MARRCSSSEPWAALSIRYWDRCSTGGIEFLAPGGGLKSTLRFALEGLSHKPVGNPHFLELVSKRGVAESLVKGDDVGAGVEDHFGGTLSSGERLAFAYKFSAKT